jgi:hypothetical protein
LSLLASMLATRTFRPSVVVLIWSVVALTTFLISSRTALCAFLAFLNAFPPSSRVDLRAALLSIRAALTAVLPSAVAGFVAVCASTLTSGFPILTAPLLAVPIDPVAPR